MSRHTNGCGVVAVAIEPAESVHTRPAATIAGIGRKAREEGDTAKEVDKDVSALLVRRMLQCSNTWASTCQEKLARSAANLPRKRWPGLSIMGDDGAFPKLRRSACTAAGKRSRKASPPRSAGNVEDAALHRRGVAIAGPPQVSVTSLLETSVFTQ